MFFAPQKVNKIFETNMGRRHFLKIGATTAAAAFLPFPVMQAHCSSSERSLSLYCPKTGESFKDTYFERGKYVQDALDKINQIMRDSRTGDIHLIDPNLLDILFAISRKTRCTSPMTIISGYRSPATNAWLRKRSRRVARKSMHLSGKAADIRIYGIRTSSLKRAAVSIKGGGVGYYPRSHFIHVDSGPIRYW